MIQNAQFYNLVSDSEKTVLESKDEFMSWLLYTKATLSHHKPDDSVLYKLWTSMRYGAVYMLSKRSSLQQCKLSVSFRVDRYSWLKTQLMMQGIS